ncbi:MAG TPA: hypothetical protein VEJ18_04120 [Planctomycetota bacterium]|nr:hypothetical protein [Planctomycetota bacterium]
MLLVAALLCLQQEQTAFRTEKSDYLQAVKECQAAEALIESDPRGAIERLDYVVGNARLKKIECRLRIEERPSEYTAWYDFLPYQYRGRARLALAKKSEPEAALKLVAGAIQDLEESVARKIAASRPLLESAKAEQARLKALATVAPSGPARPDPAAAVRSGLQPLLDTNRFKSARAWLDKEGRELDADARKAFAEEIDRRCRTWLVGQVLDFRIRFTRLESLRDIEGVPDRVFDGLWNLPAPGELTLADPAYAWATAHRDAFKAVQTRSAGGETLLAAAAAAAGLEDPAWYTTTEALAFEALRDAVAGRVTRAADLPKAERDALRKDVDGLVARYKAFADGLDPAARQRPPRIETRLAELARLAGGFPSELAELDRVDLEACFSGTDPDAELSRSMQQLQTLDGWPAVTIESRRRLYGLLATAAALRALLSGLDEEAAAGQARPWAEKMKAVGGALDGSAFGPRVEAVFGRLK